MHHGETASHSSKCVHHLKRFRHCRSSADEVRFGRCVDRNLKGQELERKGQGLKAISLYEANVADHFDGSHPYERLRRIYFDNCDYANVSRVCRAYITFGQQDTDLKQKYKQQANGIERYLSAETNRSLGNDGPICPHCAGALKEMLTKARKCSLCHKDIQIRKRPNDQKSVLVTADEAEILDEQWAMVKGNYDELQRDKQRRSEAGVALAEKFGRAPSESDVKWKLLNEDLLTLAGKQDWPRYRDTKHTMAQLLSREKKHKHALTTLLEVCYLDINGPIDITADRWRGVSEPIGPWTPKFGRLNSRVIDRIVKTARSGDFTPEAVHLLFVEQATVVKQALHLPVAVDAGWDKLNIALLELARRSQGA